MMKIKDIFPIYWPGFKDMTYLHHDYPFALCKLRKANRLGRIKFQSLGVTVTEAVQTSPTGITYTTYNIDQVSTPITWTPRDDLLTPTTGMKVAFARQLYKLALQEHEQTIFERIGNTGGRAIISKQYHNDLGPVIELSTGGYMCRLYTAVAFLPPLS